MVDSVLSTSCLKNQLPCLMRWTQVGFLQRSWDMWKSLLKMCIIFFIISICFASWLLLLHCVSSFQLSLCAHFHSSELGWDSRLEQVIDHRSCEQTGKEGTTLVCVGYFVLIVLNSLINFLLLCFCCTSLTVSVGEKFKDYSMTNPTFVELSNYFDERKINKFVFIWKQSSSLTILANPTKWLVIILLYTTIYL